MLDAFIAMFLCEDRHYRGTGIIEGAAVPFADGTRMARPVWTRVHRFYSNFRTELILYGLQVASGKFQLVLELHILCAQYWTLPLIPPTTTNKRWLLSVQLKSCDTLRTLSDIENTIVLLCCWCFVKSCCDSGVLGYCSGVAKTWNSADILKYWYLGDNLVRKHLIFMFSIYIFRWWIH